MFRISFFVNKYLVHCGNSIILVHLSRHSAQMASCIRNDVVNSKQPKYITVYSSKVKRVLRGHFSGNNLGVAFLFSSVSFQVTGRKVDVEDRDKRTQHKST